jgi:hypothetical protein
MTMEIVTYMSKFISCSLQTGANVPDKLKNQIWARKYIYFHLLWENDGNKFKFKFEMESDNPECSLVEEKQKKNPCVKPVVNGLE